MLNADEVRFLAILVQKGHLPKAAAERVLAAAAGGGHLPDLLGQLGLMDAGRYAYLIGTGGEDVPPVPGYEYQGQAGFGGTSVVFKGVKRATGELAALKIMHRELHQDPVQKRRFVQEAKMLIDLDFPAVIKGYRVGHVKTEEGEERLVFIMEWAEGRTLLELLRDGKQFEEDLALYIILQTAQALQYLHGKGILHRDVKPDNIILSNDNQVKLIDLGFAGHLDK
ncbi:MAG: protein kinase, partial [Planctomycetota bacterium]